MSEENRLRRIKNPRRDFFDTFFTEDLDIVTQNPKSDPAKREETDGKQ